jgi:plastocyanin
VVAVLLSAAAGFGLSWWLNLPATAVTACESRAPLQADPAVVRAAWRFAAAEPAPLGLGAAAVMPEEAIATTAPTAAAAADTQVELAGSLRLSAEGKPLRVEEAVETVVYWRPREPVSFEAPAEPLVMTTRRKVFVPRSLPILVGSQVRFPNEDPILHNAFSTSAGNAFDTGLYGAGDGETVRFAQAGLVRVYCNVHQAMAAHVLVLDTPFYTRPERNGRFTLRLPPGPGELFVWHERATLWRKPMLAEPFATIEVQLDLSRRRVPAHLNKFGKPYRSAGSEYR